MQAGGMEVDGDEESRRSTNSLLLLYCDEDPFVSTPPPQPVTTTVGGCSQQSSSLAADVGCQSLVLDDELAVLLMEYKARERCYAPTRSDYLHHLMMTQQGDHYALLSTARSKGVQYIIYAFGRLGLASATAFNAVNYLDRFLSINCHLSWELWMVEVVSVACLSIACKLDEVNIPSLHDLQMEEVMRHSFRPSTIRDMELTLLKALQWRLACVTPYSFLNLLLPHNCTPANTASRCTRLLLRSLSEPSLLRFDASVVAASALRCVALQQDQAHHLSGHLSNLIRPLCQLDNEAADECLKMMEALHTSLDLPNNHHTYSDQQWSPISVIPFETDGTVNRSAVSRRLFGRPTTTDGAQDEDKQSKRCSNSQK